ncbi:MAG: penicillin-binding protein activator [Desulfobacteraceae bacterium]|nr:penicillin-binding protein activator [Desulfobacteraceae bacterium]
MNKKLTVILNQICYLLIITIVIGLWGCAKAPVKHLYDNSFVQGDKSLEKYVSLHQILMAEAAKFSAQGNNQDALFVYNQALALAEPGDRGKILSGIEKVLTKTKPQVIEEFIQIKNLSIPRALLLYWLGLDYAAQNNYLEAEKTLDLFVTTYPDHAYVEDAQDLLASMKLVGFKKNTIGCLLPLSGKYHVFGQRALEGIQLAVQELSKTYGQNFHVIIKDTQSNPERAAECVDELNQEKVVGILGPILAIQQAGSRAQSLGIPMIALTQKTDFPLQGDYLFSNFITPEMQVQALASYIFTKLGIKKVAILYPNERYGKRYMELFWDAVNKFNGEIVGVESYDGKNTDFATPIKKLTGEYYHVPNFLIPEISGGRQVALEQNKKLQNDITRGSAIPIEPKDRIDFQALFIPDSVSRINLILPQLTFNDAKGMVLLGTNLWHQPGLLTGAKGYNKKAVITDGYFGNSKNPITARFEKKFNELYGTRPGFLEAIAYDTVNILFKAAMGDDVDSRQSLKNVLQGTRIFEGATGNTIFDKTGSPHKELFLLTVKKGKFKEISH